MKRSPPTIEDVRLLTPEQASELLHIDIRTLAAWRCRGEGPAFVKLGRLVRYRIKDLAAWLDANHVSSS